LHHFTDVKTDPVLAVAPTPGALGDHFGWTVSLGRAARARPAAPARILLRLGRRAVRSRPEVMIAAADRK